MKRIGILAIQGDFEKHKNIIEKLGHSSVEVKTSRELDKTDALIIPGGESTTILKLINRSDLKDALLNYAQTHPIMGTCAGLILLAHDVDELPGSSLKLIDISVKRNAYGRQKESFVDTISINLNGNFNSDFLGVFIRAPKIVRKGEDVEIMGRHKRDAVMVSNGRILACTFHPELTEDTRIHKYFLENFLS